MIGSQALKFAALVAPDDPIIWHCFYAPHRNFRTGSVLPRETLTRLIALESIGLEAAEASQDTHAISLCRRSVKELKALLD